MPGNRASASSAAYWAETSVSRDCPLQVIESKEKPGGRGRCRRPAPPSATVYRHRTFRVKSVSVSRRTVAGRPWRCKRSSGGAGPWECRVSEAAVLDSPRAKTGPKDPAPFRAALLFSRGILGIVTTGLTRPEGSLLHSVPVVENRAAASRAGGSFPFFVPAIAAPPASIFRSFLAPTFAPDNNHRSARNRRGPVEGGAVRHQGEPFSP